MEICCNISTPGPDAIAILRSHGRRMSENLDMDTVRPPLLIRSRRPGERFFPLGAPGSKKLSDYLTDAKIPPEERRNIAGVRSTGTHLGRRTPHRRSGQAHSPHSPRPAPRGEGTHFLMGSFKPTTPARPFAWRDFILVFVVALVARTGFGWVRMQQSADPAALEFPDENQYWFMAGSLARGDGLRDDLGFRATRMPLYPAFLSLFVGNPHGVELARASQWIIGAMAAPLIAALGQVLAGRRVGLTAGVIVALDPFLVFFSSLLLTETLTIIALCTLWLLLAGVIALRPLRVSVARWLAIGATAALCVYVRESNIGLVVIALLFTTASCRWERHTLLGASAALVCVLFSLLPWSARNRTVLGEWCWLTTRSGISLTTESAPGNGSEQFGLRAENRCCR
jgi:tRNA(Ile)-lysidine synthetase-like protein